MPLALFAVHAIFFFRFLVLTVESRLGRSTGWWASMILTGTAALAHNGNRFSDRILLKPDTMV